MRNLSPTAQGAKVVCISRGDHHRARVLARRDALVEAHLHLVKQIAERVAQKLPPSFDIEDLEGVGQVALVNSATSYRPEAHAGAPFDAYARPRIHGAMIDSIRRSKYTENTRPSIDNAPIPIDRPKVVEIDRRIQMQRATAQLDPRQRLVIELHYDQDLTLKEIAERMDVSPSLVSWLHNNALAALRDILAA